MNPSRQEIAALIRHLARGAASDEKCQKLAEYLHSHMECSKDLARRVEALEAKIEPPTHNLGGPVVDFDEIVRAMKEREARERLKGGAQ